MLQMLGLQMRDFSEVVRGGLGVRFLLQMHDLQMHDFSEVRRVGLGLGFFLQMFDFSEVVRVGWAFVFFYKCLTSPRSLGFPIRQSATFLFLEEKLIPIAIFSSGKCWYGVKYPRS